MAIKPDSADAHRSQLYKGVTEVALLLLLKERAHYGLELLDRLNRAAIDVADGTIYPVLHRLERQELIRSEWVTETPNGRPRRYYAPTSAGLTRLEEMLNEWRRLSASLSHLIEGTFP